MKRRIEVYFFSLLLFFITGVLSAREIFVGDLVSLHVTGISKKMALEAFEKLSKEKDIKVEEIREEKIDGKTGIFISFRSFSLGENHLNLGKTKATIQVKSTLTDQDKERNYEIYLNREDADEKKIFWGWPPYQSILGTGLILSGIFILLRRNQKKKAVRNPFLTFEEEMQCLPIAECEYKISELLRELIDYQYRTHFLNGVYEVGNKITYADILYIEDLDHYKFSRKTSNSVNYRQKSIKMAYEIFQRLREEEEDV
jgi:hypothetical protein